MNKTITYLIKIVVIAALYFILGSIGLSLALQQATPLWLPSGLAMAAVLIYGYHIFPAIFLGSLIVNIWFTFSALSPVATILGSSMIALGSTLAALFGGYLVNRFANGADCLNRVRDTNLFIILAGALSPVVAATIGSLAVMLVENITSSQYGSFWFTWWVGDMAGILMLTPSILIWRKWTQFTFTPLQILEAILLFGLLMVTGYLSFWAGYPLAYTLLLFLMWAVFRFGFESASIATLMILCMAIWGTVAGHGSFVTQSRVELLTLLTSFIAIFSITFMLFSAILKEREQQSTDLLAAMEESLIARKKEDAAVRANKAKSIFLATMSQEFYAPLNNIVGNSDLAIEKVTTLSGDKNLLGNLIADIQKIKDSGIDLRNRIVDVLELSKLEMGHLELKLTNFNLTDAIHEVLEMVQTFKTRKDIEFNLRLDERLGNMFSDRNKIKHILHNVLTNVSRFAPAGLVSLDVERKSVSERDWFIFTIFTSAVIGQDEISKIFESIEKGDTLSPIQYSGWGLGLAIDKQLCKMLEGEMIVTSDGKGTAIIIRLPVNIQYLGFLK